MPKIGVIVGSLRQTAYSKKVATFLANLLPESYEPVTLAIDQLPLYNPDLEGQMPEWDTFRNQLDDVSGIIFATPEYNRSIPAALKNALDIGTKPHNHWKHKVAIIASSSPDPTGGFGANHQLRQILVTLNVMPVQRPELYLGHVDELWNHDDLITNRYTINFLQQAVDAFAQLHDRLTSNLQNETAIHFQFEPGRFFAKDNDGTTIAEIVFYDHQNHHIVIDKTYVADQLRGQGVAGQLMRRVIRFAILYQLKIELDCEYAASYFAKHPELKYLLAD